MTDNNSKTSILKKILDQEKANGYSDFTVIGGLDSFLQKSGVELKSFLGNIETYSSLSTQQRENWASSVLTQIAQLDSQAGGKHPVKRASHYSHKPQSELKLHDEINRVRGVSVQIVKKLSKLGISTIKDLIYLYPHRHNDYQNIIKIADLEPGKDSTIIATVWECSQKITGPGKRSSEAVMSDETGNVRAFWFNNPYMAKVLSSGSQVALSGRVNLYRGQLTFESPEYEIVKANSQLLHTGRLVPIYPSTAGLPQRTLRGLVQRSLDACLSQINEFMPDEILTRAGLVGLQEAISKIHHPRSASDFNLGRRRLAFDELFLLQYSVHERRRDWRDMSQGVPLMHGTTVRDEFLESLPFKLTGAQKSSLDEIIEDMKADKPMARMLQGDVGSGKTVVAVAALITAVLNGCQGALMVPTEILAEQHFATFKKLLDHLPVLNSQETLITFGFSNGDSLTVGILVGSMKSKVKEDMRARLLDGSMDVVIGTQSIIQSSVDFKSLALIVVDEQHRFGVMQRSDLRNKGLKPHLLSMSATPIPRSLALTMYGDLDMSIINQLPSGRQEIKTRWISPERREVAYNFVRAQVKSGRQSFVVYPLIDESDVIQARSVKAEYKRLSEEVYPDFNVGLLHGRMTAGAKEKAMKDFKGGQIDILVSTPVIEVGIDVPNATVMLIDGAERFGLAQLHQFRGRVGRGEHESFCLLITEEDTGSARERVQIIERVRDGFELAEADLAQRGPGDYFGVRQSGIQSFKIASLFDRDLIALSRKEAILLLESDPQLLDGKNRFLREAINDYQRTSLAEMS
tara:strand:+ start:53386 stop:55791 length:2406 start_codon:yes stop_codon:yes gene_type:complete